MNLFTGLTNRQIISAVLMFGLFNLFALCEAAALAAFSISSRPSRRGRVRTGSLLHLVGAFFFMWSMIATVWAAPAEKSFVDGNGTMFAGSRFFGGVIPGIVFMVFGLTSMLAGAMVTSAQKREAAQQSLASG
jgi:hypothetical protein